MVSLSQALTLLQLTLLQESIVTPPPAEGRRFHFSGRSCEIDGALATDFCLTELGATAESELTNVSPRCHYSAFMRKR